MVINMKVNGKKIKNMVKLFILIEMEMFLKVILKMDFNMVKVFLKIKKMVLFILGNMLMDNYMEKQFIVNLKVKL